VFNELLLRTDGDAERALEALGRIGDRYGWFDGDLTLDHFRRWLERQNLVERQQGGRTVLTRKGEQSIRTRSLDAIFAGLRADAAGEHRVPQPGIGGERLPETRAWEFGDGVNLLDVPGTVTNAIRRGGYDVVAGDGDISISEEDFRVHDTEHSSSCATVLLVDVSHSMILYGEDRITPAKRVALAMTELITTRYPKDALHVCLFGDEAWEVPRAELPYIGVGPYHTNTRAGLQLAQEILRKSKQANRQIFMVTDGKPSALTERNGQIYKNPFGLDRRVVNKTLDEAANCRRRGIPITTFMLTDDPMLVDFVEQLTRINRGRAYYSRPEALGEFVFVDYLRNRRRKTR
jgi:Ca-activated chloride channel family protein